MALTLKIDMKPDMMITPATFFLAAKLIVGAVPRL